MRVCLASNAWRAKVCRAYYPSHGSIGWAETKGLRSKIMATYRDQEVTEEKGSRRGSYVCEVSLRVFVQILPTCW